MFGQWLEHLLHLSKTQMRQVEIPETQNERFADSLFRLLQRRNFDALK